jgi:hypothetical protein
MLENLILRLDQIRHGAPELFQEMFRVRTESRQSLRLDSVDLLPQPAHSIHEELIEVGGADRQKTYPLKKRTRGITRLREHSSIEFEPT